MIRTTIRFTPELFTRLLSLCRHSARLNSKKTKKDREFNIKLPFDLHEDISFLAKEWGRSFNSTVLVLLNSSLARTYKDVDFSNRVIGILSRQSKHRVAAILKRQDEQCQKK